MNEIIINQETMSSLQIAELTGKQHAHVMRDIRTLQYFINKFKTATPILAI